MVLSAAEARESGCPSADTALQYLGGALRLRAGELERHIDGCDDCRRMFAALAQTSLGTAARASTRHGHGPVPLGEYLPAGTSIDRYEITGVLGRGGMGVVYEATDPELQRSVALKVLRAGISDSEGTRLLAEARAMGRLSHPNVCAVYHVGTVEDRYYLVMERIQGPTLSAWLTDGTRSVGEILDVFFAAGEGLSAAHAISIVHRDFKPANVLVDQSGRVVVSDFGLAVSEAEDTQDVVGTPYYMAPEQREGRGDTRVDQYAFALSLHDALGPLASREQRGVLDRAREPDPDDRYPDLRTLLDALRRARKRGRPRVWLGVAATALAVSGGVAFGLGRPAMHPSNVEQQSAPAEIDPQVQALVDQSIALEGAANRDEALRVAEQAIGLAIERGDVVGRAEGLRAKSYTLFGLGRTNDGVEASKEAFFFASQANRDALALRAAMWAVSHLAALGRSQEALTWGRHAEGKLDRLEDLAPEQVASFESAMASAHASAGQMGQAQARNLQSVARLREREQPRDLRLASALADLGAVELRLEQPREARAALEEAVSIYADLSGRDDGEYAMALAELAVVLGALDEPDEALMHVREARRVGVTVWGASHPNTLGIEASMIGALTNKGEHAAAQAQARDAFARAEEHQPYDCVFQQQLGTSLQLEGRCDEARPVLRRALDCWHHRVGSGTQYSDKTLAALDACDG